jgi:hypothetical protein
MTKFMIKFGKLSGFYLLPFLYFKRGQAIVLTVVFGWMMWHVSANWIKIRLMPNEPRRLRSRRGRNGGQVGRKCHRKTM